MNKTILLGMNVLVIAGMSFCSTANAGSIYHSKTASKYAAAYTSYTGGYAEVAISVTNRTAYLSVTETSKGYSFFFNSNRKYWYGSVPLKDIRSAVAGGHISINVDTCTLTPISSSGVNACGPVNITMKSSSVVKRSHGVTQLDFYGEKTNLVGLYTQYNATADGTISMNGNDVTFDSSSTNTSAKVYTGKDIEITVSNGH